MRLAAFLAGMAGIWAAPFGASAQQGYGHYYGQNPHWGGGWFGMLFGPIMMIVVIAVAVVLVVLLVRWLGAAGHGSPPHPPSGRTPIDILKERFARGEIDKEEFEERRRLLSN